MDLLIRRARLAWEPERMADLLIQGGKVAALGEGLEAPGAPELDAGGLTLAPGLVDMHVHLRQPGFEYKETIETGCAAAARGGVTTLACMPNTSPVIDTPELVEFVRRQAALACGVRVLPLAAVSMGQKGRDLTDAAALAEAGVVALSDDGVPIQSAHLMRQALRRAGGLPILSHCEDAEMVRDYAVNEGAVSQALGLPGRPAVAEEIMVMRDAMLAQETGGRVHICHVSTARSVEIVRQFKKRGVAITCETCPQYFTLTEEEVLRQGAMARVNPPLRTARDVEAIVAGLQDGAIDAIVTDHAPHSAEEKARPLTQAPSGMVGLETSLAVALTQLYHTGKLTLPALIEKMTASPARILGIPQGRLEPGLDGDAVLFDPEEEWVVNPAQFASKGRNTPFAGRRLKGRVRFTIVAGRVIYRAG
ncbi:MAG: dihydroorotase [Oscillospiraceae bacterium]|nr:dihydroorotase [Oscillospiraceae bacterium]